MSCCLAGGRSGASLSPSRTPRSEPPFDGWTGLPLCTHGRSSSMPRARAPPFIPPPFSVCSFPICLVDYALQAAGSRTAMSDLPPPHCGWCLKNFFPLLFFFKVYLYFTLRFAALTVGLTFTRWMCLFLAVCPRHFVRDGVITSSQSPR